MRPARPKASLAAPARTAAVESDCCSRIRASSSRPAVSAARAERRSSRCSSVVSSAEPPSRPFAGSCGRHARASAPARRPPRAHRRPRPRRRSARSGRGGAQPRSVAPAPEPHRGAFPLDSARGSCENGSPAPRRPGAGRRRPRGGRRLRGDAARDPSRLAGRRSPTRARSPAGSGSPVSPGRRRSSALVLAGPACRSGAERLLPLRALRGHRPLLPLALPALATGVPALPERAS